MDPYYCTKVYYVFFSVLMPPPCGVQGPNVPSEESLPPKNIRINTPSRLRPPSPHGSTRLIKITTPSKKSQRQHESTPSRIPKPSCSRLNATFSADDDCGLSLPESPREKDVREVYSHCFRVLVIFERSLISEPVSRPG